MQETDIIYNLLTFLNSSKEEDMYYSICLSIIQNLKKVPNCSINELADLCFTSTATISRFSKKFGYANFHEFKKEVAYALIQSKDEIFLEKSEMNYIKENPEYGKSSNEETKATGVPVKTVKPQRSGVAEILAKKHPECNF